jgi:hypothetical protein
MHVTSKGKRMYYSTGLLVATSAVDEDELTLEAWADVVDKTAGVVEGAAVVEG